MSDTAKVFAIAVKTLVLWVCYVAIAVLLGLLAHEFGGFGGVVIYAGAWILPITVRWAYLTFKSFYEEEA